MKTPLVIIGAGGHGRELLDIVIDINRQPLGSRVPEHFDFLGFIDDGSPDMERLTRLGARYIGNISRLRDLPPRCKYSIGIGSGSARRRIDNAVSDIEVEPATLIHSSATVGMDVRLKEGAVICPLVSVTTNVSIGRHVHINRNCAIGHDVTLADYSTVNPLSAVSGDVFLGEEATIGTNSAVNQGIHIGQGAMIASGSAVTKDVAEFSLVAGVPAEHKKALK